MGKGPCVGSGAVRGPCCGGDAVKGSPAVTRGAVAGCGLWWQLEGMVWEQPVRVALGTRAVPGGDNGEDAAGGSALVALGGSSGGHMLWWQWGVCSEGLVWWQWGEALRSPCSGGRGALGVRVGAAVVAVGRSRAPRCVRAMGSSEEAPRFRFFWERWTGQ